MGPKQQYSRAFRDKTVAQALGSTSSNSTRMQEAPVNSVQRMHQDAFTPISERLVGQAWHEAQNISGLVVMVECVRGRSAGPSNTPYLRKPRPS